MHGYSYAAIKADVDTNGDVDFMAAYNRMKDETVTVAKSEALVTEADVLGGLGMSSGSTLIAQLEAALPAPVIRVIQSRGIDMAHAESQAQVEALRATIGNTAADWLIAQASETKPKWPNLKPGYCQNAMQTVFGKENV